MVNRLNEELGLTHRLSVWQFEKVRRYELVELLDRIGELYQLAHGHSYENPASHVYQLTRGPGDFRYRARDERRSVR